MNNLPTYETQFNKITEAYIKGEIEPLHREFCFCGTLACVNKDGWIEWSEKLYSSDQLSKMEAALLVTLNAETVKDKTMFIPYKRQSLYLHPNYEIALFNGMCAALDVLKQIHIERGEVIDTPPTFIKRKQLC